MDFIATLILALGFYITKLIISGVVIYKYVIWFILPFINKPEINLPYCIAFWLLIRFLTTSYNTTDTSVNGVEDKQSSTFISSLANVVLVLLSGYIIHSFISG